MALEDSEQKQNLLHSIYSELGELSLIFETDNMVQQLNEVNGQVTNLQQKILKILPRIQQMADVSLRGFQSIFCWHFSR